MRPPPGPRPAGSPFRAVIAFAALALLTSACASGGGGGGGGSTEHTLHVLVVNRDQSTDSHMLTYSGGAPLADSEYDETVESCTYAVVQYALEVPFQLMIDGVPAIVSDELPNGVPGEGESDLIASIDILADGTVTTPPADPPTGPPVAAGRDITGPSALGICD